MRSNRHDRLNYGPPKMSVLGRLESEVGHAVVDEVDAMRAVVEAIGAQLEAEEEFQKLLLLPSALLSHLARLHSFSIQREL